MQYKRLQEYQKWASAKLPQSLLDIRTQYNEAFSVFMQRIWTEDPELRQFSPLVKGMLTKDRIVYNDQGFIQGEREYIKAFAKAIYNQYGDPQFRYTGYDSNIPAVKQYQALQRFSPKITPGANKRRYENLQKYFSPKVFKPNMQVFEKVVDNVRKQLNLPEVHVDFQPEYVRGLFASHASNVGYPFYRNELSKIDGKDFRQITVELANQLIAETGSAKWICAVPAAIIGRDQPGGNTLDLDKTYTIGSLLEALDKVEFKDSKARVVFAVSRISNAVIIPFLKATIDHPEFKSNPIFCGFLSREARVPLYAKFESLIKKEKLTPINVDFSSFDTTISEELLLTAMDLLLEKVSVDGAPDDIIDSVKASAIYQPTVVYNPSTKRYEAKMKKGSISSGHGYTGAAGLVCARIAWTYALYVLYGEEWVERVQYLAKQEGTFDAAGLGDDLLALVKDLRDLPKLVKIIEEAFGMSISIDSIKTAVGIDFLQELFWDGSISYPIARIAPSALYTERHSGKGFAMWDMSFASMLNNLKTNPGSDLITTTKILQSLDTTDLGLKDLQGKTLTENSFMDYVRHELAARDAKAKQALWDGDPAKETQFDAAGDYKSEYINWYFNLIRHAIRSDAAPFSVQELREVWRKIRH